MNAFINPEIRPQNSKSSVEHILDATTPVKPICAASHRVHNIYGFV